MALCLQEMEEEDGEQMKFCSVLEVEQPDTFTEAVRIAMERDDYERVPEDMGEYGKQVLRRVGADDGLNAIADSIIPASRASAMRETPDAPKPRTAGISPRPQSGRR